MSLVASLLSAVPTSLSTVAPLVLALSLLPSAEEPSAPAEGMDDVLGTWAGEVAHDGLTAPVGLQFERKGEEVRATIIIPAFHGRAPLGSAKRTGNRIQIGDLVVEYDAATQTITSTFAKDLVPRYQPQMRLHRVDSFELPARPEPEAPIRQPAWTLDLGAPLWADAVFREGRVFVGGDDGRLHAVDARRGRAVWTFKAGGAIRARASFVGGDVVVPSDDGYLYRVDAKTGAQRWRVRLGDPVHRVPISEHKGRYENRAAAVAVEGQRLYVGTSTGQVLALGAGRGERLWEFRAGDSIATTPTIAHGRVYVGSFDRNVYALRAYDGGLAWKYDTGDAATSDVAALGEDVVIGSRSYDLERLDAKDGTSRWKKYFWFSWVESSPVVFEGAIYVGSSDAAKVLAVEPGSGRSLWEADGYGSAWGRPAVTKARVYEGVTGVAPYVAPHRGGVMAFDRSTGRLVWWYPAPRPDPMPKERTAWGFPGGVAVGAGMVFAGGLDGVLRAFEQ
jgi:outer membrane protein assembly factor BamB